MSIFLFSQLEKVWRSLPNYDWMRLSRKHWLIDKTMALSKGKSIIEKLEKMEKYQIAKKHWLNLSNRKLGK